MSKTSLILAFLIMLLLSCDEGFLTDCDKCYTDLDFSIKLNIVFRNPDRVPVNPIVTIYEGNISDSIILSRVHIADPFTYMYYPAVLYKDYSATTGSSMTVRNTSPLPQPAPGYDMTRLPVKNPVTMFMTMFLT